LNSEQKKIIKREFLKHEPTRIEREIFNEVNNIYGFGDLDLDIQEKLISLNDFEILNTEVNHYIEKLRGF
jgi:hypothetical protein